MCYTVYLETKPSLSDWFLDWLFGWLTDWRVLRPTNRQIEIWMYLAVWPMPLRYDVLTVGLVIWQTLLIKLSYCWLIHNWLMDWSTSLSQQDAYSKLGGTSELVVRITDAFGNTALHKAAEAGSLSTLQWLVSRLPNDCLGNITNGENLSLLAVAVKVCLTLQLPVLLKIWLKL